MLQYREVQVLLTESPSFSVGGTDEAPDYRVANGNQLVYAAACRYGTCYAQNHIAAVNGIIKLIDGALE